MSKLNAISLTAHLKILDDTTLGNSFLGLDMNSKLFGQILVKISVLVRTFLSFPCSTLLLVLPVLYSSSLFLPR